MGIGHIGRLCGVVLLVLSLGCTQGHCRRKKDAPGAPQPIEAEAGTAGTQRPSDRVLVYKYDGSLQCGRGKPVSLEAMQKQLGSISVFSMVKKADGLMHIQVCGSATGMANVYEIAAKDLKSAEAKGFKRWEFQ